jgi:hypothetical protein
MSDLVKRLRGSADDPMWADHAEISKTVLTRAADRIEVLEAALRKAVSVLSGEAMSKSTLIEALEAARAALAPEQDK